MGEKAEAITAIYKVNLHCQQCWREIKRPLLKTQGKVHYFLSVFPSFSCQPNTIMFDNESPTSANLGNDHEFIIKKYSLYWYEVF